MTLPALLHCCSLLLKLLQLAPAPSFFCLLLLASCFFLSIVFFLSSFFFFFCFFLAFLLQLAFVLHSSGPKTLPQGSITMVVKDGSGRRPIAQSAKRHFLNRLETSSRRLLLKLLQLAPAPSFFCLLLLASCFFLSIVFFSFFFFFFLLSSFFFFFVFFCFFPTFLVQRTFVLHSSVPRTLPQGSNTMAVKDGPGRGPLAQSSKRHFLNRLETSSKP